MARGTFQYTTDKRDNWLRKVAPRYVRAIQAIQSIGKVANDDQCEPMPEKVEKIEQRICEELQRTLDAMAVGKYSVTVESL